MTAPFAVSAQRPTPRQQEAVSSPRPLRRLLPRIRPYLWRLLLAFVCLLASAGIALAFPQIVRHLLDAAFISADASLLNRIALGLLILFAIQAVLNFVQVYLLTATSELVIAHVSAAEGRQGAASASSAASPNDPSSGGRHALRFSAKSPSKRRQGPMPE